MRSIDSVMGWKHSVKHAFENLWKVVFSAVDTTFARANDMKSISTTPFNSSTHFFDRSVPFAYPLSFSSSTISALSAYELLADPWIVCSRDMSASRALKLPLFLLTKKSPANDANNAWRSADCRRPFIWRWDKFAQTFRKPQGKSSTSSLNFDFSCILLQNASFRSLSQPS